MNGTLQPDVIRSIAEALDMPEDLLPAEGVRSLLERRLRDVNAAIFEITGRYNISSVAEMETLYETGAIEEAESWRDRQRLDHLEYSRNQLQQLLEHLG